MTCLLVTMLEIKNKERGVDYFIEYLAYFRSCGERKASPHPKPGVRLNVAVMCFGMAISAATTSDSGQDQLYLSQGEIDWKT